MGVAIRYIGKRPGNAPFYGSSTRLMYRFGTGQPTGTVHQDDAAGFLALTGIDKFERV